MSSLTPESPPDVAQIPAFSRRQAMDWSLVLASQGIDATIQRNPEAGSSVDGADSAGTPARERWLLLVRPDELSRAQESIRLYRAENRGWSWRQELPGVDLELHWGAIVFCTFLAMFHTFVATQLPHLRAAGLMNSQLVEGGQWWRLFTPIYLHDDLSHLTANVTFGIIVLGLSMARFGAGLALLSAYAAGAIGNIAGYLFYASTHKGLGASGMMMGGLGLIAIHSIHLWRTSRKAARYIFSGVGAGFLLFVIFGVDPSSDVLAHFGGFVTGLIFGGILAFAPAKLLSKLDLPALIFFVTFSALVWILALR